MAFKHGFSALRFKIFDFVLAQDLCSEVRVAISWFELAAVCFVQGLFADTTQTIESSATCSQSTVHTAAAQLRLVRTAFDGVWY